ncbi:MAG: GNAT family N-acetyltransferase [Bacteroidaceae bacterium]|nr:GNAT family N-acetyltransferase [Bacteroidaceae bacterium]
MERIYRNLLPRESRIISAHTVCDDRGNLCIADDEMMPFKVKRTFWIYGVPDGKARGGHAHRECAELIFPLSGGFDIMVDDGKQVQNFTMSKPDEGIYIGPYVWCELTNFKPGTVCIVFASHPYMSEGYINDYESFKDTKITVHRYTKEQAAAWDKFIDQAGNGTFLLKRRFMDYHSDRFTDASMMYYNEKGSLIALLPANYDDKSATIWSHQGLTYGGLIMTKEISAVQVGEIFKLSMDYYQKMGAQRIIYKPIPYIYNNVPGEDDLYWLFRFGARLKSRGLSQTVQLQQPIKLKESRKSGIRKAEKTGIVVERSTDVASFWNILEQTLLECHGVRPVHSIAELELLMSRFPNEIKLYVARLDEKILAGSLVFDCGKVVHTQYLAASVEGKQLGALDLIINQLITKEYADREYLDFGISTEEGGKVLNEGLTFQKETFGGHGVSYDAWELEL